MQSCFKSFSMPFSMEMFFQVIYNFPYFAHVEHINVNFLKSYFPLRLCFRNIEYSRNCT